MSPLLHQHRIQIWLIILKWKNFFSRAEQDLTGDIVLYRINRDGGIERLKFNYDGTDMYLLDCERLFGV